MIGIKQLHLENPEFLPAEAKLSEILAEILNCTEH